MVVAAVVVATTDEQYGCTYNDEEVEEATHRLLLLVRDVKQDSNKKQTFASCALLSLSLLRCAAKNASAGY